MSGSMEKESLLIGSSETFSHERFASALRSVRETLGRVSALPFQQTREKLLRGNNGNAAERMECE